MLSDSNAGDAIKQCAAMLDATYGRYAVFVNKEHVSMISHRTFAKLSVVPEGIGLTLMTNVNDWMTLRHQQLHRQDTLLNVDPDVLKAFSTSKARTHSTRIENGLDTIRQNIARLCRYLDVVETQYAPPDFRFQPDNTGWGTPKKPAMTSSTAAVLARVADKALPYVTDWNITQDGIELVYANGFTTRISFTVSNEEYALKATTASVTDPWPGPDATICYDSRLVDNADELVRRLMASKTNPNDPELNALIDRIGEDAIMLMDMNNYTDKASI